jgi:CubicO group peptidase (beta-lactamase class C family)
MKVRIRIAIIAGVLVCMVVLARTVPFSEHVGNSQPQSVNAGDIAQLIQRIEAPQIPNRQGLDGLTLQEVMVKLHTPGVSIAVIKDFKVQWAKGYGLADLKTGRPVEVDTMFQAASISKPTTAMAAMKFVQDGRFSLDDDVNQLLKSWYVPESEFTREQPVTPRSLFSHTSGADDGFGFPGYPPGAPLPTLVQILNGEKPSNVGPVKFARPPYQGYKYSGGGIVIMQVALTDMLGSRSTRSCRARFSGHSGCRTARIGNRCRRRCRRTRRMRMGTKGKRWMHRGMCIRSRLRPGCGLRRQTWPRLQLSSNVRCEGRQGQC